MTNAQLGLAGAVLAGAALGGCGSAARTQPPVSTPSALARVSGTVRVYGGPMRPDGTMAMNGNPMQAVTAVVVKQAGRVMKRSTTNSHGHYSVTLPAGTYVIVAGCSHSATVVAGAGEDITRDLQCDVP